MSLCDGRRVDTPSPPWPCRSLFDFKALFEHDNMCGCPPPQKKKEKEKISCLARIPVTALWLHPALLATLTTTCDFFLVNTPHCVHETATSRRAALLLVCLSKSEHCTNRCGSASRSPIYIFFYPGAIIMLPRGLAGLAVGRHGSLGRRGGTSPS